MDKKVIAGGIAVVLAIVAAIVGATVSIKIEEGKVNATIIYSQEEVSPTIVDEGEIESIETGQGEIKVEGEKVQTVESVENNGPVTGDDVSECPEGEECGRGAAYPKLDISSPQAFANQTLGVCLNVDDFAGAQCWDSMSAFFYNYVGRVLQTCGTGAAKGTIADGCWQKNAGSDFTMIWDATQIQPGDIAVYSTGQWGHIGMAMGYYNNGYFTLLGQNQGGAACPGGGAAGNIINLSTRDFIGAFRPNIYIKPEPEPEPEPEPAPVIPLTGCLDWNVVAGDTMIGIGYACENVVLSGEALDKYADGWISQIYNPGNSVYYGWTHGTGYGLYAGDYLIHDLNR